MTYTRILICVALALAVVFLFPLVAGAQPAVPHTLDGRSACSSCHTVGGAGVGAAGGLGMPTNHQGRADATCSACHAAAAAKPAAPAPAPAATAAPAKPAAPAATPAPAATAAPKPAATPAPATPPSTAPAQTLPKSGGLPIGLLALVAVSMIGLGWALRRQTLK